MSRVLDYVWMGGAVRVKLSTVWGPLSPACQSCALRKLP